MPRRQEPTTADALSVAGLIDVRAESLRNLLTRFVHDNGELVDHRSPISIEMHPYKWPALERPGRQSQSRLMREYERFSKLIELFLHPQSKTLQKEYAERSEDIRDVIERRPSAYFTARQALELGLRALTAQVECIHSLHSDRESTLILVPDTNALYWNTQLDQWRVPNYAQFSIALTPIVLGELDTHKSRSDPRGRKAQRLIRQIDEYRQRGRLVDGVSLVKDEIEIFAVSTTLRLTDVRDALGWFEEGPDDSYVAAALDVMRTNSRCQVVLVTRDQNLRSKIELSGFTWMSPSAFIAGEVDRKTSSRKGLSE